MLSFIFILFIYVFVISYDTKILHNIHGKLDSEKPPALIFCTLRKVMAISLRCAFFGFVTFLKEM